MLAAIVVLSILSGFVGVGATQMLDMPLWVGVLAYPVAGCVGLIATAAMLARSTQTVSRAAMEPVPAAILCTPQQQ